MKSLYSILVSLLIITSFNGVSQNTLSGKWRFVSYKNLQSEYIKIQNYFTFRYGSIMLEFKDSLNYGHFEGHTISNSITGEYQLIDDSTILFSKVTRGLFPEKYEIMDIRRGLTGKTNYYMEENTLHIFFNDMKEELVFTAVSYDIKGIWRIKQITDKEKNNPNLSFDPKLRIDISENTIRLYNVDAEKKDISREIIQTNLFERFEVEPIKNNEIKKINLDPLIPKIFDVPNKYEIIYGKMYWYSDIYKIEFEKIE